MKTYEEMADSALKRIHEHERIKKRCIGAAAVSVLAAVAVGAAVILNTDKGIKTAAESSPAGVADSTSVSVTEKETSVPDESIEETSAPDSTSADSASVRVTEKETAVPGESGIPVSHGGQMMLDIPAGADPEEYKLRELISSYPANAAGDMPVPRGGEVILSYGLDRAIKEYGSEPVYNTLIELWDGNELVRDRETLLAESERLFRESGVITGVNTIGYPDGGVKHELVIPYGEADQLRNFPASEKYGYILSLYGDNYT